ALTRHERVAGADIELVSLEVAEHAEAVPLVNELNGESMRARLDGAVVDVEGLTLGQGSRMVGLGKNLSAVEGIDRLDQAEGGPHVVLVADDAARGADHTAQHRLLEQLQLRL